ncbi:MAG: pyridoxal phosphate-dependent aminotransferase [Calditrichaeota bacterium]|nr:MAG: pyridoxal phosphate-dependent aminotransferase [Calditrichota bacterium]
MRERDQYAPAVHINLNVRGKQQSATLEINERARKLRNEGRTVYNFGLGQSPFPVASPVVEELKRHAHEKDYLPVRGLPALQDAVARFHNRKEGTQYSAEDIMIGPGSKELMFILQLAYYGDLLIPTPSWVSYSPQASIIGRNIHWLPTHGYHNWHLMPETLEDFCKKDPEHPRLLILNYPANPTGKTYVLDELKKLAQIARKYRIILLSDEIYGELNYNGKHVSIARFYPEGTIISSGLSKWCGAGGWRLGTFAFPRGLRWLRDAMAVIASETYTSTSAPIQFAAIRAFDGGPEIENYLQHSRKVLRTLARQIHERLQSNGAIVTEPKGAFYIFPDFSPFRESLNRRGISTSKELCRRLLDETGVAALPGSAFGRPPEELTVRMAFVDFDGEAALRDSAEQNNGRGHNRVFVQKHFGHILKGIDTMNEWLLG